MADGIDKNDVKTVADRLVEIGLTAPKKPLKEQGYPNLVLCIVDAVFATQARPGSAQPAVRSLQLWWDARKLKPRASAARFTVSDFLAGVSGLTDEVLAEELFGDARPATGARDRTRARVVVDLASNLSARGIERKADVRDPKKADAFDEAVLETKGVGPASAARVRELVAEHPVTDAMVTDFVASALGREIAEPDARDILARAAKRLAKKLSGLTYADVEQFIWQQAYGFVKRPAAS
ncbi:MAG: hypothetical protein N3B11_03435 [Coriobacteriia bacterium]|nr:hypothetical protein [Coriobacteriia bacterium]